MPQTDTPRPGKAETVACGIRRIVAPNPGPLTCHGTNTYLVGETDIAVVDPGPAIDGHLGAILAALGPGQRVSHILVSHAHLDHSPLARALSRRTGAPVLAFGPAEAGRSAAMQRLAADGLSGGEGVDRRFAPDQRLPDGGVVEGPGWRLQALWTPGHMGNHLSFRHGDVLFSGDMVMGWSTSLVSPPDGDMSDYMASLARLRKRGCRLFLPGHGPAVADPAARIDVLVDHRRRREAQILAALGAGPADGDALLGRVYADLAPPLRRAAARNLLAHLIDLQGRGLVRKRNRGGENLYALTPMSGG